MHENPLIKLELLEMAVHVNQLSSLAEMFAKVQPDDLLLPLLKNLNTRLALVLEDAHAVRDAHIEINKAKKIVQGVARKWMK